MSKKKKVMTEEKKLAREAFLIYKALKKGYRFENIRFADKKTAEKMATKLRTAYRSTKSQEY